MAGTLLTTFAFGFKVILAVSIFWAKIVELKKTPKQIMLRKRHENDIFELTFIDPISQKYK